MLDYYSFGHPLSRVRSYFALRARQRMFNAFMHAAVPSARDLVLDLGVTPDVHLGESNLFSRLYPFKNSLIMCSIEEAGHLEQHFLGARFVKSDGGRLPFDDQAFTWCFCSAVLEHVGTRKDQAVFVQDIARVADGFFITTPNRWFPVEMHTFVPFLHWLPWPWFQFVLRRIGKPFLADTRNLNLLTARDLLALLPEEFEGRVMSFRTLGWTSNLALYGTKKVGSSL